MRLAAAILAGGRARRLGGVAKGLIEIGGRPIVARARDALAQLATEVLLIAGDPTPYAALPGLTPVRDRSPGEGPLAGLEAALLATSAEALLVVGCDLPFLDPAVLRLIASHAPEAQAVVPRVAGRPQALHARYSRTVLPEVEARLARGERRLLGLLQGIEVAYLEEPQLRAVDPQLRSLTNVNTPEDVARAQDL
jgi:molybdopterin-guanine dinucleotide biosynthesis protein A